MTYCCVVDAAIYLNLYADDEPAEVATTAKRVSGGRMPSDNGMARRLHQMISAARLDELIAAATVDCYGEDEEHAGLLAMIEEEAVCPFRAKVIGEIVEVTSFQMAGLRLWFVCPMLSQRKHTLCGDKLA